MKHNEVGNALERNNGNSMMILVALGQFVMSSFNVVLFRYVIVDVIYFFMLKLFRNFSP